MAETCECGRALCDLCGENRAAVQMKNKLNGNTLKCCQKCYEEVWGDKIDPLGLKWRKKARERE